MKTVVQDEMKNGSRQIRSDEKVEELKRLAGNARDLDAELKDLRERVREKESELRFLYESRLPDLMTLLGFDHVGVPPNGNLPGVDFKLQTMISANIAASWPEDQRQKGYKVLRKFDAEDLIKARVTASLPKGQVNLAQRLVEAARKLGIKAELKEDVNHQTLSAWLRSVYADGGMALSTSDLEAIGAFVGQVVKPTERKD